MGFVRELLREACVLVARAAYGGAIGGSWGFVPLVNSFQSAFDSSSMYSYFIYKSYRAFRSNQVSKVLDLLKFRAGQKFIIDDCEMSN